MLAAQPTAADPARQDPFRWSRADIVTALDDFWATEPSSERDYAKQHGIPPPTFNYWVRPYGPADADPIDAFFRSAAGELVLRCIRTATLVVFQQRGACGLRRVSEFLRRTQLDRFVASSRGVLQPLTARPESDLVAFRDQEQASLAPQMKPRTLTLVPDEHFHSGTPCLVALEPVSGFLLVECYRDRRDADTWTAAIDEGKRGLPVEVIQLTSDRARALICCAEKGLQAAYRPDLFHDQRDLLQPLLLPLLDTPLEQSQSHAEILALIEAVSHEEVLRRQLEQARQLKNEAVQHVRGVGDDYHPFDRNTGLPVTAEEGGKRLTAQVDQLAEVVNAAGLPEKATQAVTKARTGLGTLMGCVAWFWCLAKGRLEELELSEAVERIVKEKRLPGYYWAMAARRARTAPERTRLKERAEALTKEAWQEGGALAALSEEERKEVAEAAREIAGLFQRSSSCVEGRKGRLSLQHHGHSRVSEQRLKALTVIHNYRVRRADGTTAAERFFGQKHKDVFAWLLERLPDLPRPAQKRPKSAA